VKSGGQHKRGNGWKGKRGGQKNGAYVRERAVRGLGQVVWRDERRRACKDRAKEIGREQTTGKERARWARGKRIRGTWVRSEKKGCGTSRIDVRRKKPKGQKPKPTPANRSRKNRSKKINPPTPTHTKRETKNTRRTGIP